MKYTYLYGPEFLKLSWDAPCLGCISFLNVYSGEDIVGTRLVAYNGYRPQYGDILTLACVLNEFDAPFLLFRKTERAEVLEVQVVKVSNPFEVMQDFHAYNQIDFRKISTSV